MTWVEDTLRTFGESIQLGELTFNDQGVVCLEIEKMGTLYLEQAPGTVLVYLSREMPPYESGYPAKALAACHFREALPIAVTAAMRGDNHLVFVAQIPEVEFSPPTLDRTLEILAQLHDKAA
ncbi:CesT family type III secretion system chaperone [Sulfidibacter corallicola]|uniref:CesT family type III secretion system chaperone n=1 Tax=Sulfidibacter corallicola TaxID=2818388 RepID=A0A8A4TMC1_SULCO|nr:CesT family type III secretion system chaperone [Sulfidibacter corallicola]QTD51116.1 CesT family type III secretion system chaperone [Sulfidibacter corallicola]